MRVPAALKALFIQCGAFILVAAVINPLFEHFGMNPPLLLLALTQGAIAAASARLIGSERWWLPIHFLFLPAIVLALSLGISGKWYFACFALLFLVYWNTFNSRVPLYLSNKEVALCILRLLPEKTDFNFADLGSGLGDMLFFLAPKKSGHFFGIESAPLPYLFSKIRCHRLKNCAIAWGNYEKTDLSGFDFVYVFLSPEPMPKLWEKARAEMKPGSILVSNSFAVPGMEADETIQAGGKTLYRWNM